VKQHLLGVVKIHTLLMYTLSQSHCLCCRNI